MNKIIILLWVLRLMLTFLQRQGLSAMALHCLDTRAATQSSFTRRNDNIFSNISPGRASAGSAGPVMAAVTDMVRADTEASWAGRGVRGRQWVGILGIYVCIHRDPGYLCTGPRLAWLLGRSWPLPQSLRHRHGSAHLLSKDTYLSRINFC